MEERTVNRIGQDFSLFGLLRFVFPSILTNIFTQIFKTLDDGLFVSRFVGKTALAGLNILTPLHFIQFSVNGLFSIGAPNISSRLMGEGKQTEAKQVFSRVVIAAFSVGTVLALLSNLFARPLLTFLGADDELIGFGLISIRTVFLAAPLSMVNVLFNSYYSTAGKPTMGLFCSILNGSVNVILDIILIAVMKVGVLGACLSTMFGEIAVFIVGLVFYSNKNNEIHFVPPEGRILPTAVESCKNGLPQSFNTLSASLTSLIANHQLLRYVGNDGVAANSIITDLRRILTAAFFGFITTIGPIVSYTYGSRNSVRMRKLMRQTFTLWAGGSVLLTVSGLLLRHPLISIFLKSDENARAFYEMTRFGLTAEFLGILFFSGNVIFSRLFTAVRLRLVSSSFSLIRSLMVRCACLLGLPLLLGVTGIWIANPVCELVSFMIGTALFLSRRAVFGFGPGEQAS